MPGPHKGCQQPTETLTRHATLTPTSHTLVVCTQTTHVYTPRAARGESGDWTTSSPPLSRNTHRLQALGPSRSASGALPPSPRFSPLYPLPVLVPTRGLLTFPQPWQLKPAWPLCPLSLPCRPHTAIPVMLVPFPGPSRSS